MYGMYVDSIIQHQNATLAVSPRGDVIYSKPTSELLQSNPVKRRAYTRMN
jgi:hypothetical protein